MRQLYLIHAVIGIIVLCAGTLKNGGTTKYVSIDPSSISSQKCHKAYANVYASSPNDEGALVCCNNSSNPVDPAGGPCINTKSILRPNLTSLSGAWLLPLVPLFLRALSMFTATASGGRGHPSSSSCSGYEKHALLNRLLFYLLIMLLRTYVLFVGLNFLEDVVTTTTTGEWYEEERCWYQDMLKGRKRRVNCYGRVFDFSDHVVLFYGQTLVVVAVEVLHCLYSFGAVTTASSSLSLSRVLILCFGVYFWGVTLAAAYHTAAYYHTVVETVVGWVISLVVQLPVGLMVGSAGEFWVRFRKELGLPLPGLTRVGVTD